MNNTHELYYELYEVMLRHIVVKCNSLGEIESKIKQELNPTKINLSLDNENYYPVLSIILQKEDIKYEFYAHGNQILHLWNKVSLTK